MNLEDLRPRFQLFDDVVREVERLAVDDIELAAALESLELSRQLGARLQRDDDAGRLERISPRDAS